MCTVYATLFIPSIILGQIRVALSTNKSRSTAPYIKATAMIETRAHPRIQKNHRVKISTTRAHNINVYPGTRNERRTLTHARLIVGRVVVIHLQVRLSVQM